MGNVACCQKPNEIIDDKDLLKKSSIRRDMRLASDTSPFLIGENPFFKHKSHHKKVNNPITSNKEEKVIDLEKKSIEHQPTIGPSDNMRKKKAKNLQNKTQIQPPKEVNNDDTIKEFEHAHTKIKNEINKIE